MANTQDHVRQLQEAYRLWHETKGQSVQQWLDLLADDVCFRSLAGGAPGMEFTRHCSCREEVASYFEMMAADWEMVHYTVEEFIAQGARVVMLGSCAWRHRRTGRTVETPKADFFTFKEGKIIDFLEFYDTAKAMAASMGEKS
jgi:uncharacterized protein